MIKISWLRVYLLTFILSISVFSVGNTENEFPLDPAITYGKLENGFTYYIRENQTPKDKAKIEEAKYSICIGSSNVVDIFKILSKKETIRTIIITFIILFFNSSRFSTSKIVSLKDGLATSIFETNNS